jgi:hypothetical protein
MHINYIRHLNGFFLRMAPDNRLTAMHVSLYIALFQYWNYHRFEDAFPVYRTQIMQLSKIGSKNTYLSCLKQLHQAGYIRYHPPLKKGSPARISMRRLDHESNEKTDAQLALFMAENNGVPHLTGGTTPVPNLTASSTASGTGEGPNTVHIIKQVNSKPINSVLDTHTKNRDENEPPAQPANDPGAGPNPGQDTSAVKRRGPLYTEVELFFLQNSFPADEARKFWLYNEGRGWQLAEGNPIAQWQPLAHKWMMGVLPKKTGGNSSHLFTNNDKNYDAPL